MTSSWTRTVARAVAVAAVCAGATGCDPCAGVVACNVDAAAPVAGRIVDAISGAPVAGAIVTVAASDGQRLQAATGSDGDWRVVVQARDGVAPHVDVTVESPGGFRYTVTGIELRVFDRRGESNLLGTWADKPNFPVLGRISVRGDPNLRIAGVPVVFERTGGAVLVGDQSVDGRLVTATDSLGHFVLLGRHVFARSAEPLVGTFEVDVPGVGKVVRTGIQIAPSYRFRESWRVLDIGVGLSLEYVIELHNTIEWKPAAGVEVEFRRTGGIPTTPESYVTHTNTHGHAAFSGVRPLAEGTVIADIYVRPAPPAHSYVVRNVALETFDHPGGRFIAVWGVGPNYTGPPGSEPLP